jgi:hypothetical protein
LAGAAIGAGVATAAGAALAGARGAFCAALGTCMAPAARAISPAWTQRRSGLLVMRSSGVLFVK